MHMGGAAMTPGNYSEMSSLRCEHAGALAVLLVLYAFQLYLGQDTVQSVDVVIWLDNAEVLRRAQRSIRGKRLRMHWFWIMTSGLRWRTFRDA